MKQVATLLCRIRLFSCGMSLYLFSVLRNHVHTYICAIYQGIYAFKVYSENRWLLMYKILKLKKKSFREMIISNGFSEFVLLRNYLCCIVSPTSLLSNVLYLKISLINIFLVTKFLFSKIYIFFLLNLPSSSGLCNFLCSK